MCSLPPAYSTLDLSIKLCTNLKCELYKTFDLLRFIEFIPWAGLKRLSITRTEEALENPEDISGIHHLIISKSILFLFLDFFSASWSLFDFSMLLGLMILDSAKINMKTAKNAELRPSISPYFV